MSKGTLRERYENYVRCVDDGNGNDSTTGKPIKTFDQWLNS
jgi:hypothetical protein